MHHAYNIYIYIRCLTPKDVGYGLDITHFAELGNDVIAELLAKSISKAHFYASSKDITNSCSR